MNRPLILVTGATGTIGSHLVPRLVARGARVRALVRDPRKAHALGSGFDIATADLTKPDTIAPALAGVDKLFVVYSADASWTSAYKMGLLEWLVLDELPEFDDALVFPAALSESCATG